MGVGEPHLIAPVAERLVRSCGLASLSKGDFGSTIVASKTDTFSEQLKLKNAWQTVIIHSLIGLARGDAGLYFPL